MPKIAIANRGEIARRIIRTCKNMGWKTVALCSEIDQNTPFANEADEKVIVGKASAKESYLNIEAVINGAKKAQAQYIHPGYGFLSENSQFAQACISDGLVFIGPSPQIIEKMGNKINARNAALQTNVPIIPGVNLPIDIRMAMDFAKQYGYPVLLKAASGGGGMGMQVCHSDAEIEKFFPLLQQKAERLFRGKDLFIEKYFPLSHHVEIQIIADQHGNVFHAFERECSIQRRNQKIIEETPSPTIDDAIRTKMYDCAVNLAKEIGYTNVGTMEFLVDSEKNFYFLEMNTRIQVEHPITEMITDLDLVELQLQIALGESLRSLHVSKSGHAIEARIYSENPQKGFLPSIGTINEYREPKIQGIRVDSAVIQCIEMTPYYDPLIAKVIAFADNRNEAIDLMKQGLSQFVIRGVITNKDLLLSLFNHEAFILGNTPTRFLQEHLGFKL